MQVQRITPYQAYSSNRVQRTEAKNPNFGMKIVCPDEHIVTVVGPENLGRARELIQGLQDGLAERFQRVFMKNHRREYPFLTRQPRINEVLTDGKLILEEAIEGWDNGELVATMQSVKQTFPSVYVQFADGKVQGFGQCRGHDFVTQDPVGAMGLAYDTGLDNYAGHKIFASLMRRLPREA